MMNTDRRAAVTAGVLLIAGIVGALAFAAVEHPVLTATVSLAKIPPHSPRLPAGGLIEIGTAAASAGIAIALYPVLRIRSQALALGAVAFRTIEAVMYTVAALITLALPGIAGQYAQASAPGHSGIPATADALAGIRGAAILAGVLAYITGALMYYIVLYRWRLIPRWLAGFGIAAEIPLFTACMLAAFRHTLVSSYTILALPIAVQEIAFAAWLLLKGFSPHAAQAPAPASPVPAGDPGAA
jgi:hypothetical protein